MTQGSYQIYFWKDLRQLRLRLKFYVQRSRCQLIKMEFETLGSKIKQTQKWIGKNTVATSDLVYMKVLVFSHLRNDCTVLLNMKFYNGQWIGSDLQSPIKWPSVHLQVPCRGTRPNFFIHLLINCYHSCLVITVGRSGRRCAEVYAVKTVWASDTGPWPRAVSKPAWEVGTMRGLSLTRCKGTESFVCIIIVARVSLGFLVWTIPPCFDLFCAGN